eukprot:5513350-Pyramimonas_sp.AAC.1
MGHTSSQHLPRIPKSAELSVWVDYVETNVGLDTEDTEESTVKTLLRDPISEIQDLGCDSRSIQDRWMIENDLWVVVLLPLVTRTLNALNPLTHADCL